MIVGGGETLQPVLYSLAVERATGEPVERARLSFCTSRGGFANRTVIMNRVAREHGQAVLQQIDRAIESGVLPPAPREGACLYCDFRDVCGPHEETRVERKDQRPLRGLLELRRLP
jgi:CRISPR/Cas system-associated exonuclease Cas4 (RecB family)